jgi:hypothetical protein
LPNKAWQVLICAGLAIACGGCSLVSLRSPPETAKLPTQAVREGCGGKYPAVLYPLADASWVLLGALEALAAQHDLKGKDQNIGFDQTIHTDPDASEVRLLEGQRAVGYGLAAVAAVSMVWGFVVAGQCSALESEAVRRGHERGAVRAKQGFPSGVYGYRFGMDMMLAERACLEEGDVWHAESSAADCTSKDPASRPGRHLEFELGALTRIVLVYGVGGAITNKYLDELELSLRAQYGEPQRRRLLSAHCAASLRTCLVDGEHPRGPSWHWPNGAVELAPVIEHDQPVLTLSYSREEASGL